VSRFSTIFPTVSKPLIAMAHVPPLPGTPLFDQEKGVQGLIDQVRRDVEILLDGDSTRCCSVTRATGPISCGRDSKPRR